MTKAIQVLKEKKELISFAIITLLLFLSCFFEECAYITVAFCVLISIFFSFEQVMHVLIFIYPVKLVFLTKVKVIYMYSLCLALIACILCIKYLIALIKKQKRLNWKTLIPIGVFLVYLILPIHETHFKQWANYVIMFAFAYLAFEYKKEIDFKKLVNVLFFGFVVSCLFGLTWYISPRLEAIAPIVYPLANCDYVRFFGLFEHPNKLILCAIILLCFMFILKYKNQIKWWEFIIGFTLVFVPAYLSLSRNFVIAFAVLLVLFLILYTIKYKKKSFLTTGLLLLTSALVVACCFYPTKIYLVRFEILPRSAVEEVVVEPPPSSSDDDLSEIEKNPPEYMSEKWWEYVYAGEIRYDPGREAIWDMYITNFKSSNKIIMFGRGISAKLIGKAHAHNTFLQILWRHGVFGTLNLLAISICFIDFKKLKSLKILGIILLSLPAVFTAGLVEIFIANDIFIIFLLMLISCENIENKEEYLGKSEVSKNDT